MDGSVADALAMETKALAGHQTMVRAWSGLVEAGRRSRYTHTGYGFDGDQCDDDSYDEVAPDLLKPYDDPDLPYTLMVSSGSTGAPKGTASTKRNWRKSNCTPGPFGQISDKAERR
jgi:long-subunit acyl-CoA synthetase (AMP-forming)